MRQLKLFISLSVALLAPVAAQNATSPPTPRCRVEAFFTPRFGSEFGSLLVRLRLDETCPDGGIARIRLGGYGGPGSKATGPTETLTNSRPALLWQAQPRYRLVLWEAASGAQFTVPIKGR